MPSEALKGSRQQSDRKPPALRDLPKHHDGSRGLLGEHAQTFERVLTFPTKPDEHATRVARPAPCVSWARRSRHPAPVPWLRGTGASDKRAG